MNTQKNCPECGVELPPDAPVGLCPRCLLQSATAPQSSTGEGSGGIASARPVIGADYGGYQIIRLLGRGGMGEVYEADHLASGRRVALKVMNHSLTSETDRMRFLREGRLAASVSHPNVIYVYGSEEIDGVPVIAMELVHEGTLKDVVRKRGPLPVGEAVEQMLQVIAGLEAANVTGVLHRDIKPGNCFVGADGTVKVGDFGLSISTLARPESMVTTAGSVLGTPGLASPEQLRGEELDVRSDIYSVGATLYHLLTGRLPFNAEDLVQLIANVLDQPPKSPADHRPDLPAGLVRVILRCLAKDRGQR
ncbi:MAG: serine/threonine-protein kinase [Limisphaerales bacterium]